MSASRVIIHLGAAKTGSSALQCALRENPTVLSDAGIAYPRSKFSWRNEGGGNARPLAAHLRGERDSAPLEELLRTLESAPPGGTLIWSSEFLFRAPGNALRTLTSLIRQRGARLLAVVYLRHQADAVASIYSQRLRRHGLSQSLTSFAAEFSLSYLAALEQVQSAFGPDLRVRVYDRAQLVGGNVVADFLEAADLPNITLASRTVNESLTAEQAAILRLLNKLTTDRRMRHRFVRLLRRSPLPRSRLMVSQEMIRRITERHADENRRISESYLQGRPFAPASPI